LCCSGRNRDLFSKIEEYIETKLSLGNILRESDEFEKVKMFLFNPNELYVLRNIDRVKSRILSGKPEDDYNTEKFKQAYNHLISNHKFMESIQ
jgi:hypothetical protein